ncbi:peptide chain release factor N(5)-glutamine methyltransferase [Prevotella sp. P6B1]|uniref:peptide chain release factor N(5)-glutamine methyltransferase n=1 Tax=Prevotella sp. P6B1 TaxID=1410613 RepID=UPI00051C5064|nr:peptide chain release factor N(5)-glutamine methyltransferase [Prevotella sp. P6B1]
MNYEQLCQRLSSIYDTGEAKAIVRWVLDVRFGLSMTDIYCGKVTQLSPNDQAELEQIMQKLEKSEPVQYVLGVADFCGRQFHVAPGVLIPRPETAELCQIIGEEVRGISENCQREENRHYTILDVGTGSGCIAVTLSLDIPKAWVTAWDISDDALAIAKGNAVSLGADVRFEHCNALALNSEASRWDVIVSNPPYICQKEANEMEANVLRYEPDMALFVPDDDPLLFYRHIMNYAVSALRPDGRLYFEINPLYADSIVNNLQQLGFVDVTSVNDQYGNARFVKASKK